MNKRKVKQLARKEKDGQEDTDGTWQGGSGPQCHGVSTERIRRASSWTSGSKSDPGMMARVWSANVFSWCAPAHRE